jgi:hypothetical protein
LQAKHAENVVKAVDELCRSYSETKSAVKNVAQDAAAAKKLWREGNKSKLIQIGVALIVFPEPTPISETVGACFVAAGAVQKGIQNRSIYVEDIKKTFQTTFREILSAKESLRL